MTTGVLGTILTLIFECFAFILLALVLIRWDTFWSMLRNFILYMVGFWAIIVLIGVINAAVTNNWTSFTGFVFWDNTDNSFIPHVGFYLLWGMIQQWLCLGYFNTRLRKGIGNRKYGAISGKLICALISGVFFAGLHIPIFP